ncbi:hypothetical protein LINPERHAP1_LOCUS24142 [Linum perenne]
MLSTFDSSKQSSDQVLGRRDWPPDPGGETAPVPHPQPDSVVGALVVQSFTAGPIVNQEPRSYKSALSGVGQDLPKHQKEWICVGERDIIPSIINGVRSLQISKSFKDKLCKPWSNTVIVRLLGKSIGYAYLCHRLRVMWKPTGAMQVVDLDKDCFLVKFGNDQDYFRALTGGPWMILEHYLIVQQWDPTFRVSDKLPAKMVVWVRFPHLPILFYHPQILTALGNLIGKTIRIDSPTQNADRGKFARMAVEIDIDEPLAPVVELDGAWQKVEYENIPELCFSCGKIRHASDKGCPRGTNGETHVGELVSGGTSLALENATNPTNKKASDDFGPWMVVSRKHRRQRKNDGDPGKESRAGNKGAGSQGNTRKGLSSEGKNSRKVQLGDVITESSADLVQATNQELPSMSKEPTAKLGKGKASKVSKAKTNVEVGRALVKDSPVGPEVSTSGRPVGNSERGAEKVIKKKNKMPMSGDPQSNKSSQADVGLEAVLG